MILKDSYSSEARKALKKLDSKSHARILRSIGQLLNNPFPTESVRVKGLQPKAFRIRVGGYRVIYQVDPDKGILGIVAIAKRAKVYN